MAFSANSADTELQIIANSTNLSVRVTTTSATHLVTTTGMPQRIDTWQHIACVFQRNVGFSVYQDGSLVGSLSAATLGDFPLRSWNTVNHRFTLGVNHSGNSSWATSRIDQVAFFNTALTQAEVQTIYNYRAGVSLLLAPVTTEVIKTRLASLLSTVANIGRVWTYEPEILEPSALETTFYWNGAVRAWTIVCEAVDEVELTNAEVERDHRMVIRGYLELNPGLSSHVTFDRLIDDVLKMIRDNHNMSGLVEYMTPGAAGPVRLRLLAQSVPCHYVELTLHVQHVLTRTGV
jgi:hypothetical protein